MERKKVREKGRKGREKLGGNGKLEGEGQEAYI